MFHIVASTGRTATSFLADCLDRLPGVAACHEGHRRSDDGEDLLPLVNLENRQIFRDPSIAPVVVANKRSVANVSTALTTADATVLVDVAYYNVGLAPAILDLHLGARAVGILRDCESFVRSVTWLHGTDPMPVGWPDASKELTARERFIAMGRARPTVGPDADAWSEWGPIERNIWLWRATNDRLLDAKAQFLDRVALLDFGVVRREGIEQLARAVVTALDLATPEALAALPEAVAAAQRSTNERHGGYQIGCAATWSTQQQTLLHEANTDINARTAQWTT